MTIEDAALAAQGFCRRRGLPWIHGCIWDRECRSVGAPARLYLHWRRHSWWIGADVGHHRRESR